MDVHIDFPPNAADERFRIPVLNRLEELRHRAISVEALVVDKIATGGTNINTGPLTEAIKSAQERTAALVKIIDKTKP